MWKQPWGSAEGWAICAGLLITGFGLQLITGPVQAGLFQYPVNVAGGLIFLLVLCIGFVVSRKITVVQWFSGLTASITSLSALLSVVLVMGFVGPGIERITMSWPFCPAVSLFLVCLGLCHIEAYRIVSLAGCSVYAEPCRLIYHAAGGDLGKRGFTPFTDDGSVGESRVEGFGREE